MKTTNLKFKVVDIQPRDNGGYYAKLFCKFVAHEGSLGVFKQKEEKQITYFYPMTSLAEGVTVGQPENMYQVIPHKEFGGKLLPVGFIVRVSQFKPEDAEEEIPCKWLYHSSNKTAE